MPECPAELRYLYVIFQKLSERRGSLGMESLAKISYESMQAYANIHKLDLNVWEYEAIEEMDNVVVNIWRTGNARTPKATDPPEQIPVSNVKGIKALMLGMKAKHEGKHNKG